MKKNLIKLFFGLYLYALLPTTSHSQNFVDATNDASIVPIQLISFKAVLQGNNVQVSWSTASETNNHFFNILRSLNGKDFSSVGTVKANGASATISNYSLLDASVPKQNLYYQLEQVDVDGKKTLSAILLIKIAINNQVQVTVFPNPIKDKKLSVVISNIADDDYTFTILNAVGTVVYNQPYKAMGNVSFNMQLPTQLQAGMYVLQVQNKTATLKIARQLLIY